MISTLLTPLFGDFILNSMHSQACEFLLVLDKTIKLWKISERDKRAEGYNLKDEDGRLRDPFRITALRVCFCLQISLCMFFSTFVLPTLPTDVCRLKTMFWSRSLETFIEHGGTLLYM